MPHGSSRAVALEHVLFNARRNATNRAPFILPFTSIQRSSPSGLIAETRSIDGRCRVAPRGDQALVLSRRAPATRSMNARRVVGMKRLVKYSLGPSNSGHQSRRSGTSEPLSKYGSSQLSNP